MVFLGAFSLSTTEFKFIMISYPWCLLRTHLDLRDAVLALRFTDYWARLEISGRALRKNRDSWRKEQRLCLRGCVAYVTLLSKQGGSAKPSNFVVVRIRASCTMPNHPTDREVKLFSIYLSSCQETMRR